MAVIGFLTPTRKVVESVRLFSAATERVWPALNVYFCSDRYVRWAISVIFTKHLHDISLYLFTVKCTLCCKVEQSLQLVDPAQLKDTKFNCETHLKKKTVLLVFWVASGM